MLNFISNSILKKKKNLSEPLPEGKQKSQGW